MNADIKQALDYWREINSSQFFYARFDSYQFPIHHRVEVSVGIILPDGRKQSPHLIRHFGMKHDNSVITWESGL